MALLIFPIGAILGWFIRTPARAAWVTAGIGVAALAVLAILGLSGAEVSPLETTVLLIGTPLAALMAFKISQRRRSRQTQPG